MLAHSFLIESSSKLLVTRTGIKARTSSILGLWFPWPIYMFFEMRFDLRKLDSGERSLPFGLFVTICDWPMYILTDMWRPVKCHKWRTGLGHRPLTGDRCARPVLPGFPRFLKRDNWHYSRYGLNPITLMLPVNQALNHKMKLFPLVSLLTIRIFNLSAIHRWKQLLLTTTIPAFRNLPI